MISLPPDITFEKRPLPGDGWAYEFRHRTLGALGRILLQGLPEGRNAHISCEVAGDPADPRTAERRAIFEPLGLEIARQIEQIVGASTGPVAPPAPPVEADEVVESKLTQCSTCNAFVAMLVFAPGATDAGRFDDYARRMYPEYPAAVCRPGSSARRPARDRKTRLTSSRSGRLGSRCSD